MKNIYIDKYTTTFVYLDCYRYFTSDAHPVVRPETLLFPNETYIFFFISYKKSVISFSSRQITFWIVIIISPLINYPLSVFFLSTLIRLPVECSEYYPPFTYFMELPPPDDFISTESGQSEISLLRSGELSSVGVSRKTFLRKQSINFHTVSSSSMARIHTNQTFHYLNGFERVYLLIISHTLWWPSTWFPSQNYLMNSMI